VIGNHREQFRQCGTSLLKYVCKSVTANICLLDQKWFVCKGINFLPNLNVLNSDSGEGSKNS
jgi:hypothetical protein